MTNKPARKNIVRACKRWKKAEERMLTELLAEIENGEVQPGSEEAIDAFKTANSELWTDPDKYPEIKQVYEASLQGYRRGMSLDEVKDALWEGFDGLLEAETVMLGIHATLGLPEYEIDPSKYIMSMAS